VVLGARATGRDRFTANFRGIAFCARQRPAPSLLVLGELCCLKILMRAC